MQIGILGGTFNPVHKGHIEICRHLISEMKLDKVIFIPSFVSPHKQNENMPDAGKRIRMLELALETENKIQIDGYEVEKGSVSYSIETIRYLKKKYINDSIYWIIGADMLFYMEKWYDYINVLKEIGFIVVKREGFTADDTERYAEELEKKYDAKIRISGAKPVNISSSMIRERVKKGLDVSAYINKKVKRYIEVNNLYA